MLGACELRWFMFSESSSGIGDTDDRRLKVCRADLDNGGACGGNRPMDFFGGPELEPCPVDSEVESVAADQRDRSSFVTEMLGPEPLRAPDESLLVGRGRENDCEKDCAGGRVIPRPVGPDPSGWGGRRGAPLGERLGPRLFRSLLSSRGHCVTRGVVAAGRAESLLGSCGWGEGSGALGRCPDSIICRARWTEPLLFDHGQRHDLELPGSGSMDNIATVEIIDPG